MPKSISICWLDEESKHYTDLLPLAWFKKAGVSDREHDVVGPRGKVYRAGCRFTLSDHTATLDYRGKAHRQVNTKYGMFLGVMEISFEDNSLSQIVSVSWDGKEWWNVRNEPDMQRMFVSTVPELPAKSISEISRQICQYALQRVRPDQQRFRKNIGRIYGEKCCISGCSVSRVLHAVHSDPHANNASNLAHNGLLMRADLHILFDTGQMAIEPNSRRIHFSAEATTWPEYGKMHRVKRLASPAKKYERHAPADAALKERWEVFANHNL